MDRGDFVKVRDSTELGSCEEAGLTQISLLPVSMASRGTGKEGCKGACGLQNEDLFCQPQWNKAQCVVERLNG